MRFQNKEGYPDYTAGFAIRNVGREERKEQRKMAKKRSCRRTQDEVKIHEKAVKMRKMTDEQLVHYVEDRVSKAYSEGFNEAGKGFQQVDISSIIKEIGMVKGIGTTKLTEIKSILKDFLEV